MIKINLTRVARKSDVAALWRELGNRVGAGRQGTIPEIVDRVLIFTQFAAWGKLLQAYLTMKRQPQGVFSMGRRGSRSERRWWIGFSMIRRLHRFLFCR